MNSIDSNIFQYRNRLKLLFPFLGVIGVAIGVSLIADLAIAGRLSLLIFGITVITWTSTQLKVSYVAIFAALTLVVTGVLPQAQMFASLGDRIVWLMIGAFILGACRGDKPPIKLIE